MPNTYLTPSASRHSTKTSLARRAELTFAYPDPDACASRPDASTATLAVPRGFDPTHAPRRLAAALACLALARRPPRRRSRRSSSAAPGSATASASASTAPTATRSTASTTRRSSATTTRARRSATVAPAPTVRVLLQSASAPSFTRCDEGRRPRPGPRQDLLGRRAGGRRRRAAQPGGPQARDLRRHAARDRRRRRCGSTALAGNGVRNGRYRGALEFRAGLFSGVVGDQRRRPRGLHARRRRRRVAGGVARRGAGGPGGRRALLRDHDRRGQLQRRLHRLPRHALADVPRRRRRVPVDRGGRRAPRAARSSPTPASRSSPTSSPPAAAGPRTSRTRSSARCRGRGCEASTTRSTPSRRGTAGARTG